jgi:hypothetical protein
LPLAPNRFDIEEIIDEHAGGLKFNELLVELITRGYKPNSSIDFIDDVESLISGMEQIKILHYVSRISNSNNMRDKMFVYRESV